MKSKARRRAKTGSGKTKRARAQARRSIKPKLVGFEAFPQPNELQKSAEAGPIIELVPMVLRVQNVLVPIDFSEPSEKALSYGMAFAKQFGAKITLLHVIEPSVYPKEFGYGSASDSDRVKAATDRLRTLAQRKIEPAFPVQVLVGRGPPFEVIAAMSRDLDIDLIVIATRGYTGLKHVLIGSTAERVVRHAQCPVLVVRERERELV
jgi:universal stress protein A